MDRRDKATYARLTSQERESLEKLSGKLGIDMAKTVGYSLTFTERNLRNLK